MFFITKQSALTGLTPHTFACNLHCENVANSNVYTPPAKYLVYSTCLEDFTYVMNKYDIPISPKSFTSGIISLRTSSSSLCYECGGGGGGDRGVALRRQHQTQLWKINQGNDKGKKQISVNLSHLLWTEWRPFPRRYFRCTFFVRKVLSQKFVLKGPIDNNPALVCIMARRRIGDKPLSELMLTRFTDAYVRH